MYYTFKKFFKRRDTRAPDVQCIQQLGVSCVINPQTRNKCKACRYQKCISVGMSRQGEDILCNKATNDDVCGSLIHVEFLCVSVGSVSGVLILMCDSSFCVVSHVRACVSLYIVCFNVIGL